MRQCIFLHLHLPTHTSVLRTGTPAFYTHRRPSHSEAEQQQQHEQEVQQPEPEGLTELQQQLLTWYRKTCLVAGAGMGGSVWHWYRVGKHKQKEVFIPPRAQALPPEVVAAWKKKAEMKIAMRTIGRHTLFISGIAALYFGVELGAGIYREQYNDWLNTAAAGAVAGSYLGARTPSSMRGRTFAVGGIAGGLLGAVSGWCQQQLTQLAAATQETSTAEGSDSRRL